MWGALRDSTNHFMLQSCPTRHWYISSSSLVSPSTSCPHGMTSPITSLWQPKQWQKPLSSKQDKLFFCKCLSVRSNNTVLVFEGETRRRLASPSTWRVSGQGASVWTKLVRAYCRCGRDSSNSWTESALMWPQPFWQLTPPHICLGR